MLCNLLAEYTDCTGQRHREKLNWRTKPLHQVYLKTLLDDNLPIVIYLNMLYVRLLGTVDAYYILPLRSSVRDV